MGKTEIYFDGVCNTCNTFVDFLLRHDPKDQLRFASLQSEYAKAHLPASFFEKAEFETIVVRKDGRLYTHAKAIGKVAEQLPFPYNAWAIAQWIPFVGDGFYRVFAKNRYRLFGKSETCRMPSEKERAKFLE